MMISETHLDENRSAEVAGRMLSDKYDGSIDEEHLEVAQGAADVLLNHGRNHGSYGILGRPPEVHGHDPKPWARSYQQYQLGRKLALSALSASRPELNKTSRAATIADRSGPPSRKNRR